MDDTASRLNRILASPIRRKILELIRQRGEMSYVEIRTLMGQVNTGQLNYHLKVIGDLVSKNTVNGKYILSETGISALNMNFTRIRPLPSGHGLSRPALAGVAAPIILLSTWTYYVFFYLDIVKASTIATVMAAWIVVVFFVWRGTFYHVKSEKMPGYAG